MMHHVNKRDIGTLPPGSSVFPIYSDFFYVFQNFFSRRFDVSEIVTEEQKKEQDWSAIALKNEVQPTLWSNEVHRQLHDCGTILSWSCR